MRPGWLWILVAASEVGGQRVVLDSANQGRLADRGSVADELEISCCCDVLDLRGLHDGGDGDE